MDDEPLALDLLEAVLRDHPIVEVAGRASGGEAALARLEAGGIDLVFLDVEMPQMSGLELAAALAAGGTSPMIVFATAHAAFAVEAFALDAVDYVLKPFEPERVLAAVEKASVQRPYRLAGPAPGRALAVSPPRETLPVRDGARTNLVRIGDILWAEAAGDYALLHAEGQTYTVRMTLRELERDLERVGFLRVHRSAIVRTSSVASLTPLPKGEATLTLTNGTEVKASRTYRAAIEALARGS